jgi:hypothetical protein
LQLWGKIMMKFHGEVLDFVDVEKFVGRVFSETQHAKRVVSIARATLGVISSASLIVNRIGRGLAKTLNLSDKHAVKQVDRLLSNKKLQLEETDKSMVQLIVGNRKEIKVTMDWTDFDTNSQATIFLNMVTSHGRATPLLWKTHDKNKLKDFRNDYEDEILLRLKNALSPDVKVTILADRGFFDIKLFRFLEEELGFEYFIRVRNNVLITDEAGITQSAAELVSPNGRTKVLRDVTITGDDYPIELVAIKHEKGMKAPWCIVGSDKDVSGSEQIRWYAKRWGCESFFRDNKDLHFGMGLDEARVKNPEKRDRIFLISALATILLTFLGAASEKIGLDKYLKVNTSKKRTVSLLRQGLIIFNRLEKMAKETAEKLMIAYSELILENQAATTILGVV